MKVIHDNERETSPSVLFQALTFFVWIGALALLAASVKQAQKGHPDPRRFVMAVIHPIPWCVAVVERRRVRKFLSNTVMLQDPSIIHVTVTRIVWSGYLILALVEYWFYWPLIH